MANKKELPKDVAQALENGELEEVSGGIIIHSTDTSGEDIWFAQEDFTTNIQPFGPMGPYCPYNRRRIGPYKTKEEAIQAAKDEHLICLPDYRVVEMDELTSAKHNK